MSYFICNQTDIETKLKSLINTGTSEDGWTHYYRDENNDEIWHSTQYNSEYHGGGVTVLKKLPPPTIVQLINIALTSIDLSDITGASRELYEREKYQKENFRDELIKKLESYNPHNLSSFDKERFKTIIYESSLFDSTNIRGIVGKHWTEINKDAQYYSDIASKAKQLLNEIEKYSS
jgi:hypothetical protein